MSGTGKSTVIGALAARGHKAVDADEPEFSELVSVPEGELTGLGFGADWMWREDRIDALLATQDADTLFVSGTSPNQGKFYARFDLVVLLTAPAALIAQRLATRTNNNFGKDPDQLARTLRLQQEVEPLLRRGADMEVDTTAPLDEVVATIVERVL
jgi:dephospho-CoA kinase